MSDFNPDDYKLLPGKARRRINTKTGEEISDRQFKQMKNIAKGEPPTLEKKAAYNKSQNEVLAYSRPAKGRSSLMGKEGAEELAKLRAAEAKIKPVKKIKTVSDKLLKPGRMAAAIPFRNYRDYLELAKEAAEKDNHVWLIGIQAQGLMGAAVKHLTLKKMHSPLEPISEEEFNILSDLVSENYNFVLKKYVLHLAFEKDYAIAKSEEHKAKQQKAKNKKVRKKRSKK